VEKEESRRVKGNNIDDTTPWLEFTQWRERFPPKYRKIRLSELKIQELLANDSR
jgi:hypothetical protein